MSRRTPITGRRMPRLVAAAAVAAVVVAAPIAAAAEEAPVEEITVVVSPTQAADAETAGAEAAGDAAVASEEATSAQNGAPQPASEAEEAAEAVSDGSAETEAPAERMPDAGDAGTAAASMPAEAPVAFAPEPSDPVAKDDHYTVVAGEPFVVPAPGLLVNDIPGSDSDLHYASFPAGQPSWITSGANGGFTITAPVGGPVELTVQYQAVPWSGEMSEPAELTVTVLPVGSDANRAPLAMGETFMAYRDQVFTASAPGVLANDSDPDGDPLTVKPLTSYAEGDLRLDADGTLRLTPLHSHQGSAWIRYLVCDAALCALAEAKIQVLLPPVESADRPTAATDVYTVSSGEMLTAYVPGVLANDIDPNGEPLTVTEVDDPDHGTVQSWSATGGIQYIPDPGFIGVDTFHYVISNGTYLDEGQIEITVTECEQDCDQNAAPAANDDAVSVVEGETRTFDAPGVLANDTDADGDTLQLSGHTTPAHGGIEMHPDGSFTYVAENGYVGVVDVEYKVTDGTTEVIGNLRIEVTPKQTQEPGGACPPSAVAQPCDDPEEPEQPGEPEIPADPEEPTAPEQPQHTGGASLTGLAQTGADSTGGLLAAALALTAGAALISIRRRTQRR